jgi:choice-of-anchor A domain-containing protein
MKRAGAVLSRILAPLCLAAHTSGCVENGQGFSGDHGADAPALAAAAPIEVHLNDYNLFLMGSYSGGHAVAGKIAAAGDISMTDFSVGVGLPADNIANTLVAGGDLVLSRGGIWGHAAYGAGYSADSSVTSYRGTVTRGEPVNFAARAVELRGLSLQLGRLAANGTARREPWGGVMLTGTDPVLNVFDVDASAFTGAVLIALHAPAGSFVLVNVDGTSATFANLGISLSGGIHQRRVLYNFVSATTIHAQGVGFLGTMLAPYADIAFNDGVWDGGIYARSLAGNAEGYIDGLDDLAIDDPVLGCESYPGVVLGDEPAGYWRLDDTPGVTIADWSGNGITGALWNWNGFGANGLITEPGNRAGAFGVGGIRLPTERLEFDASQGLAIEAWVRVSRGGSQIVFSQQSCSQRTLQLWVENNVAMFRLVGYRDDGSAIWDQRAYGTSNVVDGLPHHLVGVRDLQARTISIYVDGRLEASVPDETQTSGRLTFGVETVIGRRPWCGQTNEFNGTIDEVAVYRKALLPDRIAAHHRAGRCVVANRGERSLVDW